MEGHDILYPPHEKVGWTCPPCPPSNSAHATRNMVNTCCVPGCKTGYKTSRMTAKSKKSEKYTLFRFPQEEGLQEQWLKAIPRQKWKLNKCHKVCAKYFQDNDFQVVSSDQKHRRRITRRS